MKKIIMLAIMAAMSSLTASAQENTATVEKSIFNVQPGFLGVYVNNESRLADKWALRTEVGVDAGFSISGDDSRWALLPVINLEPRYYYNIAKRAGKGRNTAHNTANFITLSVRCNPNLIVYESDKNSRTATHLFFVPKWGIRRNIGQSNFNYEAGFGLGYYKLLGNDKKYYSEKGGVAVDLHLRIGYCF